MTDHLVTCIVKPNRQSTHEHITHIGNAGSGWMLTRESVIARIDAGTERYYTQDQYGHHAFVGVVREAGRAPYLRTYADGVWNDNLLALPECPGSCKVVS